MQARYYDPVIGRFYSNDPEDVVGHADIEGETGYVHGFNRYAYVGNNPFKYEDPSGENRRNAQKIIAKSLSKSPLGKKVNKWLKEKVKTFQTYIKENPKTGEKYTGRTSGTKDPETNIARRDRNHHKNDEGFGPAKLDKSSTNSDAIRGREQQEIVANGGAKSQGGTSGNAINGVSDKNPKKQQYDKAAKKEFGSETND